MSSSSNGHQQQCIQPPLQLQSIQSQQPFYNTTTSMFNKGVFYQQPQQQLMQAGAHYSFLYNSSSAIASPPTCKAQKWSLNIGPSASNECDSMTPSPLLQQQHPSILALPVTSAGSFSSHRTIATNAGIQSPLMNKLNINASNNRTKQDILIPDDNSDEHFSRHLESVEKANQSEQRDESNITSDDVCIASLNREDNEYDCVDGEDDECVVDHRANPFEELSCSVGLHVKQDEQCSIELFENERSIITNNRNSAGSNSSSATSHKTMADTEAKNLSKEEEIDSFRLEEDSVDNKNKQGHHHEHEQQQQQQQNDEEESVNELICHEEENDEDRDDDLILSMCSAGKNDDEQPKVFQVEDGLCLMPVASQLQMPKLTLPLIKQQSVTVATLVNSISPQLNAIQTRLFAHLSNSGKESNLQQQQQQQLQTYSQAENVVSNAGAVDEKTEDSSATTTAPTPLAYSRSSSMTSLNSFDTKSIHSSVASEYSTYTAVVGKSTASNSQAHAATATAAALMCRSMALSLNGNNGEHGSFDLNELDLDDIDNLMPDSPSAQHESSFVVNQRIKHKQQQILYRQAAHAQMHQQHTHGTSTGTVQSQSSASQASNLTATNTNSILPSSSLFVSSSSSSSASSCSSSSSSSSSSSCESSSSRRSFKQTSLETNKQHKHLQPLNNVMATTINSSQLCSSTSGYSSLNTASSSSSSQTVKQPIAAWTQPSGISAVGGLNCKDLSAIIARMNINNNSSSNNSVSTNCNLNAVPSLVSYPSVSSSVMTSSVSQSHTPPVKLMQTPKFLQSHPQQPTSLQTQQQLIKVPSLAMPSNLATTSLTVPSTTAATMTVSYGFMKSAAIAPQTTNVRPSITAPLISAPSATQQPPAFLKSSQHHAHLFAANNSCNSTTNPFVQSIGAGQQSLSQQTQMPISQYKHSNQQILLAPVIRDDYHQQQQQLVFTDEEPTIYATESHLNSAAAQRKHAHQQFTNGSCPSSPQESVCSRMSDSSIPSVIRQDIASKMSFMPSSSSTTASSHPTSTGALMSKANDFKALFSKLTQNLTGQNSNNVNQVPTNRNLSNASNDCTHSVCVNDTFNLNSLSTNLKQQADHQTDRYSPSTSNSECSVLSNKLAPNNENHKHNLTNEETTLNEQENANTPADAGCISATSFVEDGEGGPEQNQVSCSLIESPPLKIRQNTELVDNYNAQQPQQAAGEDQDELLLENFIKEMLPIANATSINTGNILAKQTVNTRLSTSSSSSSLSHIGNHQTIIATEASLPACASLSLVKRKSFNTYTSGIQKIANKLQQSKPIASVVPTNKTKPTAPISLTSSTSTAKKNTDSTMATAATTSVNLSTSSANKAINGFRKRLSEDNMSRPALYNQTRSAAQFNSRSLKLPKASSSILPKQNISKDSAKLGTNLKLPGSNNSLEAQSSDHTQQNKLVGFGIGQKSSQKTNSKLPINANQTSRPSRSIATSQCASKKSSSKSLKLTTNKPSTTIKQSNKLASDQQQPTIETNRRKSFSYSSINEPNNRSVSGKATTAASRIRINSKANSSLLVTNNDAIQKQNSNIGSLKGSVGNRATKPSVS
jgi:hypothetical protein